MHHIISYNRSTGQILGMLGSTQIPENTTDIGYLIDYPDRDIKYKRVNLATLQLEQDPAFTVYKENDSWGPVKQKRDLLLTQSDWTELPSNMARKGNAWTIAWQNYRQALRDITKQADPAAIVWPKSPDQS